MLPLCRPSFVHLEIVHVSSLPPSSVWLLAYHSCESRMLVSSNTCPDFLDVFPTRL